MKNRIFPSLLNAVVHPLSPLVYLLISFMFVFAPFSEAKVATWEYNFADVKGDEWQNDWKVIDGDFEVKNGTLFQDAQSGDDNNAFRCIFQSDWEIENGTIEAGIWHDAKAAGMNDALLYYRMKDDDNGYASRLQLDNYITIGKITVGRHAHIKFVNTPVETETEYIVKVELEGNQITVFVDDNEFFTIEDSFSSKGRVGFGMARCNGGAHLSWIRVTGEGVKPSAVYPVGKLAITWSEIKSSN